MEKKFIISYFCIFATLLFLMSLSHPVTEKMRGRVVMLVAPIWESLFNLKQSIAHPFSTFEQFEHPTGIQFTPHEEIQRLQVENQLLTNELFYLNQLFDEKQQFDKHIKEIATHSQMPLDHLSDSYQKYLNRLKKNINIKIHALPARIIFRSLDMWNRSLWINIGEANNQSYEIKIVAKNSPVLVGNSIIGVIDYVGQHQARVRLITDPALIPSVRAARGGEQEALIEEYVETLLSFLNRKKNISISGTDRTSLMELLNKMKATLQPMKNSSYLAKGELQGNLYPSGRTQSKILKGTGFNYDFADEEGEQRDLRSGKLTTQSQSDSMPILKLDDVLITTGMDGVFPPNFQVATISKIELLKEGDYFYELEAKPTAGHLNDLSLVFVIPPLDYEK